MGWLSCNKIVPVPTLEASHSSSKVFSKFGRARIGVWVSLALISSKACCCLSSQTKGTSFFTSSFKGEARVKKLGTNLL